GLTAPLAPDSVVLDLHARPSFVRPAIEVGLGMVLVLVAIPWPRGRGQAVEVDELPVDSRSGDEPPVAPPSRRLPSVMLLNLGPSASPSELESAPPLGSRDKVDGRIGAILGATEAAQDGRATASGPGWSLAFDLGQEDQVWTITVEALGGDGSIDALERLARETGWRIFVPKLGTFVDTAALKQLPRP